MKTTPWKGRTDGGQAQQERVSSTDWLKTPLIFSTLNRQPEELEITTGLYQAWRHARDHIPFSLTLRNGEELASMNNGKLEVAEAFRTAFVVFDKVMTFESHSAVNRVLDEIEARAKRNAANGAAAPAEAGDEARAPEENGNPAQSDVNASARPDEAGDIRGTLSGGQAASPRPESHRRRR